MVIRMRSSQADKIEKMTACNEERAKEGKRKEETRIRRKRTRRGKKEKIN